MEISMKLVPCAACGASLSPKATACPKCGHPMGAAEIIPGAPRLVIAGYGWGWEYKSKFNILGLPLIHIASGYDMETRRKRIARGVIAIGDIAVGIFAMGGLSIGVIGLGGLALGGVVLGGLAIGGIAIGGLGIGYVAVGGGAVGYYAVGGGAFGKHVIGPLRQDPEAVKFFLDNLGIDFSTFTKMPFKIPGLPSPPAKP